MRLFVFGFGYSCPHFLQTSGIDLTNVSGTVRSDAHPTPLARFPVRLLPFDGERADPAIGDLVAEADLILVSVPPGPDGDPVLSRYGARLAASKARVVYLASVGVYADHAGSWIDETAQVVAGDERRGLRARTETAWQAACADRLRILRLAGIYGPGRNALRNLRNGRAHRIVKPGQVFNRIHVVDIAQAIGAAFAHAHGGIWNVCDDEPAPPQDVVTYAARLMGVTPPPEQDFDTAELTPMARSFYATSNRISNARLKADLGVTLAHPDYRSGLTALWNAGEGRSLP